jgi:hypothetical protein
MIVDEGGGEKRCKLAWTITRFQEPRQRDGACSLDRLGPTQG